MKRLSFITLFTLLVIGCNPPNTYMGQKVVEMPFPIAGGQTIKLRAIDSGPIPAENDQFKIEVAGFNIGPLKDQPKTPGLTWMFALTSKNGGPLRSVQIEEVSPSDPPISLLRDSTPKLKSNGWSGSAPTTAVSKEAIPWLFTSKTSIFIFKFTIQPENGTEQVLYQAAWFPPATKAYFVQHAAKIQGAK
jgi:hypothetical protein